MPHQGQIFGIVAHEMSEEDVKTQIKTPAVLEAFAKAKYQHLPELVRKSYDRGDASFGKYSQHTQELVLEGKMEGKIEGKKENSLEIAKRLLGLGLSDEMVCQATDLSIEELSTLKNLNEPVGE
jgi:predicted transposase/invertase (TIGR01784 family)